MEESIALAELEASWRRENEKFQKFQRLANRNIQLAKAFMSDQQKTDFEVKRKIHQDREKQVFPQISPIPREWIDFMKKHNSLIFAHILSGPDTLILGTGNALHFDDNR